MISAILSYSNLPLARVATPLLLLLASVLCLSGCTHSNSDAVAEDPAEADNTQTNTVEMLTILAGSELKDIEPLLPDIQQKTGVTLKLKYTGTLDGVYAISQGENVDTAWFSHDKYFRLHNSDKIKAQTPIMRSPVIMGVKKSKVQALGWLMPDDTVRPDITWQTITDATKSGKLTYAMTNPTTSNSGFTALMSVTAALAGTSKIPTTEEIALVKPQLKSFFRGQTLTAGSSGWLADAYIKEQDQIDAIVNYESVLMQLNQDEQLTEPLVLIYPKEGIITADYPFSLINPNKRESYDKVVEYLTSIETQQRLMEDTGRRPVSTQVNLDKRFYSDLLTELPFPNSLQLVDDLLVDFANELRNPAYSLFLLDISSSMEGSNLQQLQNAFIALTNSSPNKADNSRFTKFSQNEIVALQPFNDDIFDLQTYLINDMTLPNLRNDISDIIPSGGTAIYQTLLNSYQVIFEEQQKNETQRLLSQQEGIDAPPYYYSIVLMTDGLNQDGIDYDEFEKAYQNMNRTQKHIKTFIILFGDANDTEMTQLAELTGGKVFDGRQGNLTEAFKKIRGYQ